MSHTIHDKQKMLNRVRRIRGQLEAVEKALNEERDCAKIMQMIAACRGAINGLMGEVVEGHIRFHVVPPGTDPRSGKGKAAEELVGVLKTYLR